MKTMDISEATASLAEYARVVAAEPVVITSDGKPLMALLDMKNTDFETFSLSTNREFMKIIGQSRERQENEGGISSEEMRRRLGLSG
uniref:Antitoxin Phd_YefM, type II toxin-antitoxin system n=1 Tax=Candidatus Kentrum sp. FM TaxID=2126340 RepID=A0A450TRF8_9GAMM|nr:MAG: Antitoxin Phd_YefM, type II toxin-antitoxin system [Candidatus Kentron sp. FM]VFJ70803.1 MAG: Antitoxin Phd_YefM, type II toxin-antitoxin system [Candidatus Kentron sp. FM]VFK18728.1 MAG: Antitoxin Phd_YefM, type II toxin-antitoxin system [Candidatus Kentron sp. FM]